MAVPVSKSIECATSTSAWVLKCSPAAATVAVTMWCPSVARLGTVTVSGIVPSTGAAVPCGCSRSWLAAGEMPQPAGAWTDAFALIGNQPVAEIPRSMAMGVLPDDAGMTTGCAGDMVAARDSCGVQTGISPIRALSALAWVRQSKTLGCSSLVAPDQRVPSRPAASRSSFQILSACLSRKAA